MDLHLHESVLLLGLDDEKGKLTGSSFYFSYSFSSAIIIDLVLAERIVVEDKRIKILTNAITDNKLLNNVLQRLQNKKKTPKVGRWLNYLVNRTGKLKLLAIENLVRQKILEKKKVKKLWLFNVNRYPSTNLKPENQLRARLLQIIFEHEEPKPKERMLLTILLTCQLDKSLIPDKKERKAAKERIEALTEDSEMRKLIGDAIQEMQTIIMLTTGGSVG